MAQTILPSSPRRVGLLVALACFSVGLAAPAAAWVPGDDPTEFTLEQLVNMEVYSASKYTQRASDAPAAVTVLRGEDFRTYGWRTLADMLRSVRGIHVSSDRIYSYVGIQGLSPPGDYNMRLLVLLDGYRLNENIFDSGFVGSEFILDVDLIDRVEIVRGPGSSVYGSNALFGVVNIITRKGESLGGAELAASLASNNDRRVRASYGKKLDNGADLLLSATSRKADGPNLFLSDLGAASNNADYTRQGGFFAKFALDGTTLEMAHSSRKKGSATGALGIDLSNPDSFYLDEQSFVDLRSERELDTARSVSYRLFLGRYDYQGDFSYGGTINRDIAAGRWWGGEVKFLHRLDAQQQLVYGLEFQQDTRQEQRNFDAAPYTEYLNSHANGQRRGFYFQDEIAVNEAFSINAGLRFDRSSGADGTINPRLGLIYHHLDLGTWKLLYGSAFRPPNAYERYYDYRGAGTQQLANPALNAERIKTYTLAWEKSLPGAWRLAGDVYHYRVGNLINQVYDSIGNTLQYQNSGPVSAHGATFEAERNWNSGYRLRTSYSYQQVRDETGARLANSPAHMGKANFSAPLSGPWRLGYEWQMLSRRLSSASELASVQISNLTLRYAPTKGDKELSFSIYNLFDKRNQDPVSFDPSIANRQALLQDWRQLRIAGIFRF